MKSTQRHGGEPRSRLLVDIAFASAIAASSAWSIASAQSGDSHLAFSLGGLAVAVAARGVTRRRRLISLGLMAAGSFYGFLGLGAGLGASALAFALQFAFCALLVVQISTRVEIAMEKSSAVLELLGVGALAGLLQAIGTAAMVTYLDAWQRAAYIEVFAQRILAAVLGIMLFVPVVLLASKREQWRWPSRRQLPTAIAASVGAILATAGVMLTGPWPSMPGLIVLCLPALLLLAVVAPPLWLALVMLVTSMVCGIGTILGRGPLPAKPAVGGMSLEYVNLQLMLIIALALAWLIHAAIAHQRTLNAAIADQVREQRVLNVQLRAEAERREAVAQELRTVNERFGAAVMGSNVPMGFGPMREELGDFNDAMCNFYGVTREHLLGARWTDFMDEAVAEENVRMQRKLAAGEIDSFEVLQRIRTPQGVQKWGRVTATAVRSADGNVPDWAIAQIVDVTKEVESQQALQRMVDEDPVTGLRSRTWMTNWLRERLHANLGSGGRTGVVYVELAPYLVIYRAHGFEAGDKVLRQLGARLRPILPADALLGRFEGMTLLVVLPEVTSRSDMEQLCVEILENVAQELEVAGRRISRTGNIGAAVSHPHSTVVSLLQDADQALLRAEVGGRSRWHIVGWDDAVEEEPLEPVDLEHELREALDTGQFVMHYQPQVNLRDRSISGYEALVRWQQPTRGLIGPGSFMPLMESTGLIGRLGRQVLAMVCERIKTTPDLAGPIAVNVSAIELDDSSWLENVIDTIRLSGIDPSQLVIELTETTVLDLTGRAREALQSLRDLGVGIHIDDFGTGYTSVATLLAMPCTAVKLDMSLSARLVDPTESDVSLIRAIATLAASLGLETIAEGIEHSGQAELLRDAGWHVGQGYLFGKPSPTLR